MGSVVVIVSKVRVQLLKDLEAVISRLQIDAFVLDRPPEPLDKGIVGGAADAIPADAALGRLQGGHKVVAGKLTALVGVKNLRGAVAGERLGEGAQTKIHLQRIRQLPAQHEAAVPVEHGHQVQKAPRQRQVGDIRTPDVIGGRGRLAAQQVRKTLGHTPGPREVRLGTDRLQAHQAAQAPHPLDVDGVALLAQPQVQAAHAEETVAGVFFVKQAHQSQILRRLAARLVVIAAARQPQGRIALGNGAGFRRLHLGP
jgi:hypothetical protein